MVLALLDGGVPPKVESSRRWTPLDEAVALKDKELVKLLHARETAALKADMRARKADLLASIAQLPDTSFQVLISTFLATCAPLMKFVSGRFNVQDIAFRALAPVRIR